MKSRPDDIMWDQLFDLSSSRGISLQGQLREQLVTAILDGHIPRNQPIPSSRELAKQLDVGRNTVVLAYQHLVDEGFLIPQERRGYYVNPDILTGRVQRVEKQRSGGSKPAWEKRFAFLPSVQRNIKKPHNWQELRYPFIYGQPDPSLVPVADWRECCRQVLNVNTIVETSQDHFDHDDPLLVEQILSRVLPRRGIWASPDEILVTLGTQHALYLIASLLISGSDTVGFEEPGYPDARNIFLRRTPNVVPIDVDASGLVVNDVLDRCDYVYVTPSHQSPTTITLSAQRRADLLARADRADFIIIEDDYESETNFVGQPTPALKSLDSSDRVIYVGSLSKTVAPGLRVGFMVGPAELIREARAQRRLMLRHPPTNNQRILGLFLSLGHHDSLIARLSHHYRQRWLTMAAALEKHLPESTRVPSFGGTAFWVKGPDTLDANDLYERALKASILIEPGDVHFMAPDPPKHFFRLGFSAIPADRIEAGIERIAGLIRDTAG